MGEIVGTSGLDAQEDRPMGLGGEACALGAELYMKGANQATPYLYPL